MSNEQKDVNPLETSGISAVPQSGQDFVMRLVRSTLDDLGTKLIDLNQSDSGIGIGIHTKISTLLSAGFALIWWAPGSSSDSLTKLFNERLEWLKTSMVKTMLSESDSK